MRAILLTGLILATAGCAGGGGHRPDFHGRGPDMRGEGGGGPRTRLFISPMGEPFRSAEAPQDLWFAGADTDHDGALTHAEFTADERRFFAILDREHDGEIDPGDIEVYENQLAPEIRTRGAGGGGGMRMGGRRSGGGGGYGGGAAPSGSAQPPAPGREGAARFGYLDYPEPITVADRNFNRGIDPMEFDRAADDRFALLDANHDGRIEKSELPKIEPGFGFGGRLGLRRPSGDRTAVPMEDDQ